MNWKLELLSLNLDKLVNIKTGKTMKGIFWPHIFGVQFLFYTFSDKWIPLQAEQIEHWTNDKALKKNELRNVYWLNNSVQGLAKDHTTFNP